MLPWPLAPLLPVMKHLKEVHETAALVMGIALLGYGILLVLMGNGKVNRHIDAASVKEGHQDIRAGWLVLIPLGILSFYLGAYALVFVFLFVSFILLAILVALYESLQKLGLPLPDLPKLRMPQWRRRGRD
jgi:uncharacterized membrane protein HdeD (DUF308 family)